MSAPLLILGVHRSGTSVLSRVVQDLGVHMGWRQDANAEATFFQRINRRLEAECGGHWTTPRVVFNCADEVAGVGAVCDPLSAYIEGASSLEYWGPSLMRKRAGSQSWGWKDPRTAHLLPIWNRIYPDAPIIWIERHPAAASFSLIRRTQHIRTEIANLSQSGGVRARMRLAKRLYRGQPVLSDALRINTVGDALDLVLEYAELHREIIPKFAGPKLLRLRYEDLVTNKDESVGKVADFLGFDQRNPGYGAAVGRLTVRSRDLYRDDPDVKMAMDRRRGRIAALDFDS